MSTPRISTRFSAAAFVVGVSLAGPQALGIAWADGSDQSASSTADAPAKSGTASTGRSARSAHTGPANSPSAAAATAAAGSGSTQSARTTSTTVSTRTVLGDLPATGHTRRAPAGVTAVTDPTADLQSVVARLTTAPDSSTGVVTISSTSSTPSAAVVATSPNDISALRVPTGDASASSITDVFTKLLNSVSSFFEGIGLLVRRTFFNQAPTVAPVQTTGQTGGTITGSLNAVDPEGDPIVYSVTQNPHYGSVAVDSAGNYTYTPGSGFDGVDAFTIAATDTGLHINLLDPLRSPNTGALVSVTQNDTAIRVGFNFIFGSGAQYWSSAARAALQSTAIYLSSYIKAPQAVTITYDVTGEYSFFTSTLASAGSDLISTDPGFYNTVVQKKIQTGVDSNGAAADGQITWNFNYSWAFGDSVASGQYDFQSTALHELVHTLGFLSVIDSSGNNTGNNWTTFDGFVVTSTGAHPIDGSYTWLTSYDTNLTGGSQGLYFGGANAMAANNGHPVPLYTPNPWESGSSMSHLDDTKFTGSNAKLMNASTSTGLGVRTLSAIEIGILKDLGYDMSDPPQNLALFVIGFVFIRRRKRAGGSVSQH
ncbi:Ig-like domain-containing protein [Mycobacterium sp. DL592]|uniref:Ig-like domain-containing protein n=1 Tax=Mycobacterium sp. DL592 TaxID=2675524 RepID=UPI00142004AE|nr:Ig-like domain-containing protein [Mycobacterium sp. DL592]